MDFKDIIKQLGERVIKFKDQLQTEEATKTVLVIPFFRALGYDDSKPPFAQWQQALLRYEVKMI